MSTYLKNMAGYKHNQLKKKSFDDIQNLFDKAMKKEVVPNKEEVAIDAIPLETKPPSIVNWKIHKEGKKSYYQIIRSDGSSKMYKVFSLMLKSFDREDLETLYKLVKAMYGLTRPVEDLDLILYGDLKTIYAEQEASILHDVLEVTAAKILLEYVQVVKKEIVKLLDTCIIDPIADSPWVSLIHCVLKKGGITVVTNKKDELVPTRTVTGWRVCIDYRKLNEATVKDHFPLPFMDQMLERLVGNKYFCFLDGFSGYFQIPIDPMDQEKTTFTCPFGTYAYRRMHFGLCNAPATFQWCMLAIFHDMIEEPVKVFMADFSVFRNSFDHCLSNLDKILQRCKDAHLVLNWEKCHFMVKEGIVLGNKVSEAGLKVDKAKFEVISKLPPH
ncbi:reverse transcriptase domain-containing protein [Tanacetum coccineum]